MKAVVLEISEQELERRRRPGLDARDEMWEGVLYMAPAPTLEHQRIQDRLLRFLAALVEARSAGTLVSGIKVLVIDRDTKKPEVFRLAGSSYLAVAADRDGWLVSERLGIRLTVLDARPARLAVEDHKGAQRTEI